LLAASVCHAGVPLGWVQGLAGDILRSRADIGKAAKLLGWTPRVDFREGIEKTVAWCRRAYVIWEMSGNNYKGDRNE
jgi:nucleoside-diphosphate-sugar epimerase